jgi:hypothetical protein
VGDHLRILLGVVVHSFLTSTRHMRLNIDGPWDAGSTRSLSHVVMMHAHRVCVWNYEDGAVQSLP